MSHDDFAFEPVRGLPEELPRGEQMLWQGGMRWQSIAVHVFHVRAIAIYFGLVIAWRVWSGLEQNVPIGDLAASTLAPLGLAVGVIGFLLAIAWAFGKATVYTVTSRRIVIRSGVAFQVTFNIPFAAIRAANQCRHRDGTGNISLELNDGAHFAYAHIWPNARPWFLGKVQPTLRHVRQPEAVADLIANALKAFHATAPQPTTLAQPTKLMQTRRPAAQSLMPIAEAAE